MAIPQWTFGDRVRKVRRERGWSQEELATRLSVTLNASVTRRTVAGWELSDRQPHDLVAMAKVLQALTDVPAEWFLGLHEQE